MLLAQHDFLRQPHLEAIIAWLDRSGVGLLPVPTVPGIAPSLIGSSRHTAPTPDEHRGEILADLSLTEAS